MSVEAPSRWSNDEPVAPTGAQHVIAHGDQQATITEVGAGLRTYAVGDRPVLDGYAADERCTGGRGQTLIPWPNRIRDGRYPWPLDGPEREDWQLDVTEPARHCAIHGLTRWSPWRLAEHEPARVVLEYVLHACPGWPFVLHSTIEYSLDDHGLTVRTTATNAGPHACPYGTGAHPYLAAGGNTAESTVDSMRVVVPAAVRLLVDDVGIPYRHEDVAGSAFDFRAGDTIGPRQLDLTYTDLARDRDGRARLRVKPDRSPGVTVWLDEAYDYVQLFTGDTLIPRDRRRGLAVEPMTCPPDAFNSAESLVVLQPGASHRATWGIEPDRT